jgi:ribosome-binding protein aMBF1 (putative translation factor)
MDFKPLILRNPNAAKKREINLDNVQKKSDVNHTGMNASALERKIEEGKVTLPPKISRDVSNIISSKRQEQMIGDKKMTQKDLAGRVNLPVSDITSMENGSMILNHENKMKIRKVQQFLKITELNL